MMSCRGCNYDVCADCADVARPAAGGGSGGGARADPDRPERQVRLTLVLPSLTLAQNAAGMLGEYQRHTWSAGAGCEEFSVPGYDGVSEQSQVIPAPAA